MSDTSGSRDVQYGVPSDGTGGTPPGVTSTMPSARQRRRHAKSQQAAAVPSNGTTHDSTQATTAQAEPDTMPTAVGTTDAAQDNGHARLQPFRRWLTPVFFVALMALVVWRWISAGGAFYLYLPVLAILAVAAFDFAFQPRSRHADREADVTNEHEVPEVSEVGWKGLFWRIIGRRLFARRGWKWLLPRTRPDGRIVKRYFPHSLDVPVYGFWSKWFWKIIGQRLYYQFGWSWLLYRTLRTRSKIAQSRIRRNRHIQFVMSVGNPDGGSAKTAWVANWIKSIADVLKRACGAMDANENGGATASRLGIPENRTLRLRQAIAAIEVEGDPSFERMEDFVKWEAECGVDVISSESLRGGAIMPGSFRRLVRAYKRNRHVVACDLGNGLFWTTNVVALQEADVLAIPSRAESEDSLSSAAKLVDFCRRIGLSHKANTALFPVFGVRRFVARVAQPWNEEELAQLALIAQNNRNGEEEDNKGQKVQRRYKLYFGERRIKAAYARLYDCDPHQVFLIWRNRHMRKDRVASLDKMPRHIRVQFDEASAYAQLIAKAQQSDDQTRARQPKNDDRYDATAAKLVQYQGTSGTSRSAATPKSASMRSTNHHPDGDLSRDATGLAIFDEAALSELSERSSS